MLGRLRTCISSAKSRTSAWQDLWKPVFSRRWRDGMGMGNASRRRGADTSYQRDDDVARPSIAKDRVRVVSAGFAVQVFPFWRRIFIAARWRE